MLDRRNTHRLREGLVEGNEAELEVDGLLQPAVEEKPVEADAQLGNGGGHGEYAARGAHRQPGQEYASGADQEEKARGRRGQRFGQVGQGTPPPGGMRDLVRSGRRQALVRLDWGGHTASGRCA